MKRNKRLKRFLAIFIPCITIFACLVTFLAIVRTGNSAAPWDPSKKTNVWVNKTGKSWVADSNVGGGDYPADTMLAFHNTIKDDTYAGDVIVLSVRLTGDSHLVVWEPETVTSSTGAKSAVSSLSLTDLRDFNLGEDFVAPDGSTPYKGLTGADIPDDLRAAELADVFSYIAQYKIVNYIVKIEDAGATGKRAADELYKVLSDNDMLARVITWFASDKIGEYIGETYRDMPRAATAREISYFYCNARFDMSRAQLNYKWVVIIVSGDSFIRKDTTNFLNYAHKHNRSVFYTDVDSAKTTPGEFSSRHADGLITDAAADTAAKLA